MALACMCLAGWRFGCLAGSGYVAGFKNQFRAYVLPLFAGTWLG